MPHLLSIKDINKAQAEQLLTSAQGFADAGLTVSWAYKSCCLFFAENSTRTRCSFELAANKLNLAVIQFDATTSSLNKSESLLDTCLNLAAMGIDLFVVRHRQEGVLQQLLPDLPKSVAMINAGDGCNEHPSQALLDVMTMRQCFADISQLRVAIVGDIAHSRVTNSLTQLLLLLGVKDIRLAGPPELLPERSEQRQGCYYFEKLAPALEEVDVLVCLRIQKERLTAQLSMTDADYRKHYGITEAVARQLKSSAIIMHPGPVNRGVELDAEVADGPRSVILKQVQNGVYMRIAMMDYLFRLQEPS